MDIRNKTTLDVLMNHLTSCCLLLELWRFFCQCQLVVGGCATVTVESFSCNGTSQAMVDDAHAESAEVGLGGILGLGNSSNGISERCFSDH